MSLFIGLEMQAKLFLSIIQFLTLLDARLVIGSRLINAILTLISVIGTIVFRLTI